MKHKTILSLFFLLLGGILLLTSRPQEVKAAILTGVVDTTGTVTGTAGATYYNTNSWKDIEDTYIGVTPTAASNNTIYFNVTGTVPGNSVLNTGNILINNKSLSINGNNNTLYLDDNTVYTDAQSISGSDGTARAFGSSGTISAATTLTIKNATIINNLTSGIFQLKGSSAAATTIYQDVTVSNGANQGAQPIRNDVGKILFYGNNTFNILQNQNFNDTSSSGSDNQGEWIQGGTWIEVVNGSTVLNQSWGNDQPFYTYYTNNGSTLQVDSGATMNWNLNKTYTMYYDDGTNVGPLNWNINGNFLINGTVNTASNYSGGWFMWLNTLNAWNLNVGQNATLKVSTGGGALNIGGAVGTDGFMGGAVKWNFAQGSTVLFNNLNANQNLITSPLPPGLGSGITMTDPKVVTLNTIGGSVFASNLTNFPITISGNGLRTHASSAAYTFDSTYDLVSPNKNLITPTSTDIWYRLNTGTLSVFNPLLQTVNLTPNNYSAADARTIASDKYISWYQPNGFWVNAASSAMNRTFNISLDPTATNGTPLQWLMVKYD